MLDEDQFAEFGDPDHAKRVNRNDLPSQCIAALDLAESLFNPAVGEDTPPVALIFGHDDVHTMQLREWFLEGHNERKVMLAHTLQAMAHSGKCTGIALVTEAKRAVVVMDEPGKTMDDAKQILAQARNGKAPQGAHIDIREIMLVTYDCPDGIYLCMASIEVQESEFEEPRRELQDWFFITFDAQILNDQPSGGILQGFFHRRAEKGWLHV